MTDRTVLLVGGYGLFGARLARRLARHERLRLLVAGRNHAKAAALCATLHDAGDRALCRRWVLVARDDHGPFVPALAAAALVRRLLDGGAFRAGATPCVGLLDLPAFATEAEGLAITMDEVPCT